MIRFLFRSVPLATTLAVVVLFGLGMLRVDTTHEHLAKVNNASGWLLDLGARTGHPEITEHVQRLGAWLGAPALAEVQTQDQALSQAMASTESR